MRDVGEQRAERDDAARRRAPARARGRGSRTSSSGGSARRRAGSPRRGPGPGSARGRSALSGQSSFRVIAVDERHVRPRRLEVVEALGVDLREVRRVPLLARDKRAPSDAPWPPSFQPRKAATRTGRASSGRNETFSSDIPQSSRSHAAARAARRPDRPREEHRGDGDVHDARATTGRCRTCGTAPRRSPSGRSRIASRPAHPRTSHGHCARAPRPGGENEEDDAERGDCAHVQRHRAGWKVPSRSHDGRPELPGNVPAAVDERAGDDEHTDCEREAPRRRRARAPEADAPPRPCGSSSTSTPSPSIDSESRSAR